MSAVELDTDTAVLSKHHHRWTEEAAVYGYPAIRLAGAFAVVWFSSNAPSKPRLFSGILSALVSAFLVYTFLEPLFLPNDTSMAFLNILTLMGGCVGMSLGVLLPSFFSGICFGTSVALLVASFLNLPQALLFPFLGGALALAFSFLAAHSRTKVFATMATCLEGGAFAAALVVKPMFPFLKDVAKGHPYNPSETDSIYLAQLTPEKRIFLGCLWIAAALLVAASAAYRDGHYESLNLWAAFRTGYTPIPSKDDQNGSSTKPSFTPNPPPESLDVFNMFNPADLPPRLAEYANMVYSACEDLGNFFGFQDSSVRNQAEHLLILLSNNRRYMSSHILPPSVQPPSPIHALHAKVFSNYVKWCRAMGVAPHFSKLNTSMNAPPAVASRVVDLVLFFCIWGEGANLRHMSECVWFLYHKMMEEHIQSEGYTQTRSLYAGHFLDYVVTPIFEVVEQNMKSKADHDERKNYDDFNEFFWSRECLQYHYSSFKPDPNDMEEFGSSYGPLPGETILPVAEGLAASPKTFLEKRSWLRGIMALSRILEWHIVTFYLLAAAAFARELVWGWVYSLQVASGVFWLFNALHLTWALLEVWAIYPGIQLSGTAVCGSVFVLVARFLTLVYQTLYLMWAFSPQKGVYLGIEAEPVFWWWQYIWLSLIVMIPYVVETFVQIVPSLSTRIYTSQNDYVQSFLNILYPLSRLYVGKEVHESFRHTIVYVTFWVTLMAWKLFFSYVFEVNSMVLPSLQLADDYVNYPDQSFAKMFLLLSMRWLPQFIVYLIDMSIWYAAWQAFAGTSVGFSDHLGDVRSIDDIRNNFGRAPEHFCKKMLSSDAGSRRGSSASFLGSGNNISEGTSLLGSDPHKLQSYVNRLLDVRIQKWVMFSAAWNEIIDHFREEDIISNTESDNLKFSQFDGFSQAIYLPVFQTAGAIDDVLAELQRPADEYTNPRTGAYTDESFFKPITEHVTMQTAVAEVWELGSFLFAKILGPVHAKDVQAILAMVNKWTENEEITANMKLEKIKIVFTPFVELVNILEKGMKKRTPLARGKDPSVRNKETKPKPSTPGVRRVVSAGSLATLDTDNKAREVPQVAAIEETVVIVDAVRDQVRDKLRNLTHGLKAMLKNTAVESDGRDVLDRLTFLGSMENGFFWDDYYASSQLDDIAKNDTFKGVLKKIYGLVCMHPDDAEPKSKEARRRLTFFVNSLFMDMPDAPSIHDMFSWNVLTPFYSEDVLYSKADLERRTDALGE
ncbi:hypothetical protein FisN_30Hh044 [Fistulifera solaris]|uniref:1,3-beta-glucan synthase n=1 Tax=Fistulifera solaris TaxID=1519565 RepID=A0A1Z5K6I5_FISSO|nr:hypothetical protein FisN_30Hh044 [Fistulifera solaris]|eukprot:GAX21844.1 hypothetical protein FisN_30Hh044 [Fistulifera solaris]